MSIEVSYRITPSAAADAHDRGMSGIDSARRTEALDNVSQALTLLERVQIRWRRYDDTTSLANAAEPVAIILRTTKNVLTRAADAHSADTARMLLGSILALQKIKRDELGSVIEKTQAACEAVNRGS